MLFRSNTKSEVYEINSILTKTDIKTSLFTSNFATEEEFKNTTDAKIIHIATHGYYSTLTNYNFDSASNNTYIISKDPLTRSGLIFAGGNKAWQDVKTNLSNDDGIVTAREISTLDLSNCTLAVLSACETALGDNQIDDDIAGLQRAFKMAGVKFIIASLWKVPDSETSEFMKSFYKILVANNYEIKTSFYKAQSEMRNKYIQPSKWAAFILIE